MGADATVSARGAEGRAGRVRVLVCDDHPIVRSGLRGVIGAQPDMEVVGDAANGVEAVALAHQLGPDVVLMDLRMPKMGGAEAIKEIKARRPGVGVLVLTTYDTDADVLRAVEEGATGFLLKDAPPEELLRAIRAVAQGKSPFAPEVAARLVRRMRRGEEGALSPREVEILGLVAEGTSNREIAKALWISEATVKGHMKSVFDKLGAPDRTAAVTAALRRGIIRLEDP